MSAVHYRMLSCNGKLFAVRSKANSCFLHVTIGMSLIGLCIVKLLAFSIYWLSFSVRFTSACTVNDVSPVDIMSADDDSSRGNPALDEASRSAAVKALVNESIANLTDILTEATETRLGAFAATFSANSSTETNAVKKAPLDLLICKRKGKQAEAQAKQTATQRLLIVPNLVVLQSREREK